MNKFKSAVLLSLLCNQVGFSAQFPNFYEPIEGQDAQVFATGMPQVNVQENEQAIMETLENLLKNMSAEYQKMYVKGYQLISEQQKSILNSAGRARFKEEVGRISIDNYKEMSQLKYESDLWHNNFKAALTAEGKWQAFWECGEIFILQGATQDATSQKLQGILDVSKAQGQQ